jgi:1,4-alpha-glucan branching enzyme
MVVSQDNINSSTPLGANLINSGATFRIWAPRANAVYINGNFNGIPEWTQDATNLLIKDAYGYWTGFVAGVNDGDEYRFFIEGQGSNGYKRDPYARELTHYPPYPHCNCVVRDPRTYIWHSNNFHTPKFNDLIIYQLHIGTFYGPDRENRVAKFLDVLDRLDYFVSLGVNAVQFLPMVEYPTRFSMGYNGTDYFSPEMDYSVIPDNIAPYLMKVNSLLCRKNCPPMTENQLSISINQLKAVIDIFHLFGIAVIFDVVYNHAGGDFGDESLYFLDRMRQGNNNDSLYFTDQGWAGGLIFAFYQGNNQIRQFLIDNAKFYIEEYHIDGIRYDEVTVIDGHGGWSFCQDLTDSLKSVHPNVINIAEFWKSDKSWVLKETADGGAGFDAVWDDKLRDSIREIISQSTSGERAFINMDKIKDSFEHVCSNFSAAWKAVQCIENHDIVQITHDNRKPRISYLSDSSDSRSWYARSRSRVATGLLLTAPGIPMIFMGQEFLEDRYWSDNSAYHTETLIQWDKIGLDKAMTDHLIFTQHLIKLRRTHPALRGEKLNVFHVHNDCRVIAFHRWLEDEGRDIIVVVSLNEDTFYNYRIGFPRFGKWLEVFNSDMYDNWVNPNGVGNNGEIMVNQPGIHDMPYSCEIVLPANSITVFAVDGGD